MMPANRGRSLSGHSLEGCKLVRMVHLDEAGIGNPRQEPFVVVAGVNVHADDQWRALEQYLSDMADDIVPPSQRDDFVFHTKDLFHGSGVFDRQKWPKEKRWRILDELIAIPRKFGLPIVWGFSEREKMRSLYPDATEAND